jgi:hypothetical protein
VARRVRRARVLWIMSDPLSGGSRNQVEFPVAAGPFFGLNARIRTPVKVTRLTVEVLGIRFTRRKMDFHHNQVWRLNLPTIRQGLGSYQGKILFFERIRPGLFRLWKLPANDPWFRIIRQRTRLRGYIGRTRRLGGGLRFWGYF